jgi:hypothetical protein
MNNFKNRMRFLWWMITAENWEDRFTFFAFLVGPSEDLAPMVEAEVKCRELNHG